MTNERGELYLIRKDKPVCSMSIYTIPELTNDQKQLHTSIMHLQLYITNAKLSTAEMAHYIEMTKRQKERLVKEIYFKDKRKKEFYTCADGRVKSYNPQFIAPDEESLINKLYDYYFCNTFKAVYKNWLKYRADTKIVSGKTIEEDIGIWTRFIEQSELSDMQIGDIKPKHIMKLFDMWTGNGLITRKDFNNRKSVLNGIFRYAVLNEIIAYNPINSLPCNDLKYKIPTAKKKAYTKEERSLLLSYLKTLEPDAYILAIMLAFYGIFRIGEIKALSWNNTKENIIIIQHQLVEERILQYDMTLSQPRRILKNPKGNPYYSIRTEQLPQEGVMVLKKMKELNPHGKFLFMHEGRPLTTDSFNRRLKKYCTEIGVPYLSSHKIRFTGASMLYHAGIKPIDIQPLLGHSTLTMTQHYISQRVEERDTSQMAKILA